MPAVANEALKKVSLTRSKMYRIPVLRLFESGLHKGVLYTNADIDAMVTNFNAFSTQRSLKLEVPIVLGHEEAQVLLDMTGHPAGGWVKRVWAGTECIEEPYINEQGNVKWRQREAYFLYGELWKMPEEVAQWIVDGTYRYLSCEFSKRLKPPAGIPAIGPMLLRAAILGATSPHVKSLGPLPSPIPDLSVNCFSDTDSANCDVVTLLLPIKGATCFSEGDAMNDSMMQALTAAGVTPEVATALASLDSSMYGAVCKALNGGGGGDGGFDRAAAIETLSAAPGADRDAITKMSSDELKANMSKSKHADGTGQPGQNDGSNPGGGGAGVQKPSFSADKDEKDKFSSIHRKQAELDAELAEFRKWRQSTESKFNAENKSRADAEYQATCKSIDKFCADRVQEGRITAAEAPLHSKTMKDMAKLPTFKSEVMKFSDDGKDVEGNCVEAYMATIKARPKMKFSEDHSLRNSANVGGTEVKRSALMLSKSRIGKEIAKMKQEKASAAK